MSTPDSRHHDPLRPWLAWNGLRDDALICASCAQIKGTTTEGWHQACRCEERATLAEAPGNWDFAQAAILCRCCAGVLLPSGTRWSLTHCDLCSERILTLNRAAARLLVPVGRHSLMNGIGLRGRPTIKRAELVAFTDRLRGFSGALALDEERGVDRTRRRLTQFGLPTNVDVPLLAYLQRVGTVRTIQDQGFVELLDEILGDGNRRFAQMEHRRLRYQRKRFKPSFRDWLSGKWYWKWTNPRAISNYEKNHGI